MRLSRFLIPVAALLVTACGVDDGPTVNARPQLAGVRFIHAIADEGPVDARMVDQVEWTSFALGLNFRQSGIVFPTEAGTHKVRVWRASNNIDSIALIIEQDVTIEANKNVTLLLTGSVAGNNARIEVIPDVVPDSAAGKIQIRAVNATGGAAEVAWVDAGGTGAATAVASLGTTAYAVRDTGAVSARFNPAGDAATAYTAASPAGTLVNNGIGATAGHRASGSALVAYLFPAAVAGSRASPDGTTFPAPGVVWFVDRVPAPPR